jgi:hypothetical protein
MGRRAATPLFLVGILREISYGRGQRFEACRAREDWSAADVPDHRRGLSHYANIEIL